MTILPGLLYSPLMFGIKLKFSKLLENSWLPLLLFAGCFIASAEQNELKPSTNCRAVFTESSACEENSNGVTPSKGSSNQANVWLVAVDLGNTFAKSANHKTDKSSRYVHLDISNCNSGSGFAVNTLSQVDSDLGRLFTLLGEKPSGTS